MSLYQRIIHRSPIEKGWSGDRKYCAMLENGEKYLLRISPLDRLERKRREFQKMQQVARLGIPMCLPVEFGTCEEGVFSIQSWIDGAEAGLTGAGVVRRHEKCGAVMVSEEMIYSD